MDGFLNNTVTIGGKRISKQLPLGSTDEQIRAAFAPDYRAAGYRAPGAVNRHPAMSTEQYWRGSLGDQGTIAPTPVTIGGTIENGLSGLFNKMGMDERGAARLGNRFMAPLNDMTPVGNVTGAEEGGRQFYRGMTQGQLRQMALGAGVFGLSVLPGAVGKGVKKVGKGMFGQLLRDETGAIRAWHGSPHDFDRFSMDKIGTGEGAQAYGHGLYFAENKGVAEDYRKSLTDPDNIPFHIADKPLDTVWNDELRQRFPHVYRGLDGANSERMDTLLGTLSQVNDVGSIPSALNSLGRDPAYGSLYRSRIAPVLKKPTVGNGRLYEVNIDANPEDFLNWDAPLSQQPRAMQALNALNVGATGAMSKTRKMLEWAQQGVEQPHNLASGRDLLNAVSGYGENRMAQHGALLPHGIKGVRYLDQGSRGAGNGTHNYVVFDDKLIDILNKF